MEQKLQELTEKIYIEGVEKGEVRSREIICEAEEKAAKIVSSAKKRADSIVQDAENEAESIRQKVEAEIRLAGNQSINALKQQIADAIMANTVDEKIVATMSNPDNIKDFVKIIVQNWRPDGSGMPSMEVLLPEGKRRALESAFKSESQKLLSEGIDLQFAAGIKGGFRVGPKDGGYKVSLTDEDFREYFRNYLKPKTRELLFGE